MLTRREARTVVLSIPKLTFSQCDTIPLQRLCPRVRREVQQGPRHSLSSHGRADEPRRDQPRAQDVPHAQNVHGQRPPRLHRREPRQALHRLIDAEVARRQDLSRRRQRQPRHGGQDGLRPDLMSSGTVQRTPKSALEQDQDERGAPTRASRDLSPFSVARASSL